MAVDLRVTIFLTLRLPRKGIKYILYKLASDI